MCMHLEAKKVDVRGNPLNLTISEVKMINWNFFLGKIAYMNPYIIFYLKSLV